MADFGGGDLDAFRDEVKAWLEANYPPELRDRNVQTDEEAVWGGRAFAGSSDPQIVWMQRMADKGWTAPTWPQAYGGGGLSPQQARVLDQELNAGRYRQRERDGCEDGHSGQRLDHEQGDHGADHDHLAVREVDQAHDAVNHRVAERDQHVDAAEHQAVDDLLDENIHRFGVSKTEVGGFRRKVP